MNPYNDHDTVLAFQPNPAEPPQFVGEYSEADTIYGRVVSGPQCQTCGRTDYEVERNSLMPKFGAARCGCGQRYRIVHLSARDVVFPA